MCGKAHPPGLTRPRVVLLVQVKAAAARRLCRLTSMTGSALADKFERHCKSYFEAIEHAAATGALRDADGSTATAFYPTIALVSNTPTHIVFELMGASQRRPTSLRIVTRSLPSLNHVLGKFPSEETACSVKMEDCSSGGSIQHLALMTSRGEEGFRRRYPNFGDLHDSVIVYGGDIGPTAAFYPLQIPDDLRDISLVDVMLMAEWRGQVRARYFQSALIISEGVSSSELTRQLDARFPVGRNTDLLAPTTKSNSALLVTAANFAALASVPKIGETTITRFIEENSELLSVALGGELIVPQPILEWIEGNSDANDVWIQPDFLLIDRHGHVHVCEVKLPLLQRESLTTGGHRRRRFVSDVAEGIAQLANYHEYLSFEPHRRLIRARCHAEVVEPRLILIVGSSENFRDEEVREAQRLHAPVEIVDYDTLRALYLVGSGYVAQRGV